MLTELLYMVGEEVMYVPEHGAEDDAQMALVIENALPTAESVEIHIDGEDEPRLVSRQCVIRCKSRFISSGTPPDDETFV